MEWTKVLEPMFTLLRERPFVGLMGLFLFLLICFSPIIGPLSQHLGNDKTDKQSPGISGDHRSDAGGSNADSTSSDDATPPTAYDTTPRLEKSPFYYHSGYNSGYNNATPTVSAGAEGNSANGNMQRMPALFAPVNSSEPSSTIPSSSPQTYPPPQASSNPAINQKSVFHPSFGGIGDYHIVVSSKHTLPEAIQLAQSLSNRYPAEVYPTPNGWYAVTIGRYPEEMANRIKSTAVASGNIPAGSWLSTGNKPGKEWGGRVYP